MSQMTKYKPLAGESHLRTTVTDKDGATAEVILRGMERSALLAEAECVRAMTRGPLPDSTMLLREGRDRR